MAGVKIKTEDLAGNTAVLSDLMNPGKPKRVEPAAENQKEPEKDVHLTMLVKESTRKAWKQFFIEHDLNTTQGVEIAMLHLISDVQSGKYLLNKGGLREVHQES
ncbi:hypothetical protein MSI_06020 [Treponema sp. JC4]|uniref:hypothetical protein n=1 Tax=Treponema sp. JC4 TaxID=1124982 RepID=UPI00025B0D94|nr:hypothetical protein [Treponema sp. JC4]EID85783.1 hypothetical protein MSI_06020 [Treponema sp. JC4]